MRYLLLSALVTAGVVASLVVVRWESNGPTRHAQIDIEYSHLAPGQQLLSAPRAR